MSGNFEVSNGVIWYQGRIVAKLEPIPYLIERDVINQIEGIDEEEAYQRGRYDAENEAGDTSDYTDGFNDGLQEAADRVAVGMPILPSNDQSQAPNEKDTVR